jgi:hypothetical protein
LTSVQQQLDDLNRALELEADLLAQSLDPQTETFQQVVVRPAKTGILLQQIGILWIPS